MPQSISQLLHLPTTIPYDDPRLRLFLVAAGASLLTATTIFTVQHFDKRSKVKKIKAELSQSLHNTLSHMEDLPPAYHSATPVPRAVATDESLIREQLSRNYAFLGEEGVAKVRKSFVIVVGLGGVGSHAAHMLLRSGVEHLRLIDFDQVTLSSLNRHALATQNDVGTPKALCLQKHFAEIFPNAKVEIGVEMYTPATAPTLLAGTPDFVLDCIDNLATKVDLIKYCKENNLRVMSSMGAGAKADPSRIQIADISDTFEDPLARATRRKLRLQGVETGVTVVYSTEKPGEVSLLPLEEDKLPHADEYAALPNFRVRILPVLGTLPALFGNVMASYVVTELAGFKTEPLPIKLRPKTYERLHKDLVNKEKDVYKASPNIPLNIADVGYIFEEIWRGRSALSGTFDKLQLTRWDVTKPASFTNVVCLTRAEAEKHDEIAGGALRDTYGEEFVKFVEGRFEEERRIGKWR
ncbi:hypothetical protein HDV00_008579 [Rhizophlyctis rosea]|nr:hypothetical protein HDV00_008579 [Rhizophlyctis rosea]